MPIAPTAFTDTAPQHAAPRILDLSRSFSRAARTTCTGIDRVERAYWSELVRRDAPVWAIVRQGKNYALLDRDAGASLMRRLCRTMPGEVLFGRVAPRLHSALRRRRAAACLRRRSTYFGSMAGLMVLLSARFGQGFEYLNVGHCNLDDFFLRQMKSAGAAPIRIKLHDMIPLDFPDLVREGTPALFQSRARAAMAYADQIICNSAHTADRVAHHAAGLGARPDCLVAHLGVSAPNYVNRGAPRKPYFVCVGTIEPRKNHAFLFEVWQRLADRGGSVPKLYVVGARGWRNDGVFRLLDSSPLMGRHITECAALPDREMFALISGAAALLCPSHEEGFGLPALEARALGVQVICSPIPAFRELLRHDATMLETDDPQRWADAVMERACAQSAGAHSAAKALHALRVPTWEQHFAKVFGAEAAASIQAAQGAFTSVRTV
jgi:glycosyltransferase involved in cell wall biosynthesis